MISAEEAKRLATTPRFDLASERVSAAIERRAREGFAWLWLGVSEDESKTDHVSVPEKLWAQVLSILTEEGFEIQPAAEFFGRDTVIVRWDAQGDRPRRNSLDYEAFYDAVSKLWAQTDDAYLEKVASFGYGVADLLSHHPRIKT
jgi:hypothetical protein